MIFVEVSELADQIDDLADRVCAGEDVFVTREGQIVVKVMPCEETE